MKQEFRLTGKHLAASAMAGIAFCMAVIYFGTTKPERFFYAGAYNTHDAAFVNANPHSHREITYTTDCNECHRPEDAWTPQSGMTCDTSGCHNSLDPKFAGRGDVKYKYNPVAHNYHELVAKTMDCSACHRIHEFREVETRWFGPGFDHAALVPDWAKNSDCGICHEPFSHVGEVSDILKTVPGHEGLDRAEIDLRARAWLSASALRLLERRDLGLDETVADRFEFAPQPYSEAAADRARADRGMILLYFRTAEALEPGGICRYLEDELFVAGPIAEVVHLLPVFTVDYETAPDTWADYGVYRGGTLVLHARDGMRRTLAHFTSPTDIVRFLRGLD